MDYFGSTYCQRCSLVGWEWCHCQPINQEKDPPLTFSREMSIEDAIYWLGRTKAIFPGEEIKIEFGE